MKAILNYVICTGLLLLSGCQESNQTLSNNLIGNENSQALPDNLTGKKWNLIKVVHTETNIEETVPGNLANMNIEFKNTFRIHAMGACNIIEGNYSLLSENSIKIQNLGRTKMYCENEINMKWEDNFYNSLENASSLVISGEKLIIKSTSNITLVFKPS